MANDVRTTTVEATAVHTGDPGPSVTTIPAGDEVPLVVGENHIRVVVASVDGTQTKTYTVTVTKAGSARRDAVLGLTLSGLTGTLRSRSFDVQ